MKTINYIIINEAKFLTIKGDDKKDFLQGIITNDINKCNEKAIYSCLLSPQGKFLCDFFVIPYSNYYIIEINNSFFDDFIKKINIYKLRSKIEINVEHSFKSLVILQSNNNNITEEGLIIKKNINYIEYVDPRNKILGNKILIKDKIVEELIESNKYNLIDINEYFFSMIENMIPNSLSDLVVNKSLLLENNFDKINAIDWEKGCYIGQEITARMKYRSLLKKSLRLIDTIEGKINKGDSIYFNDKNIGYITSCIKNKGLAMMNIEEANKSKINKIHLSTIKGKIIVIN